MPDSKSSLVSLFTTSLFERQSLILAFFGLILGLAWYHIDTATEVPMYWVAYVVILSAFIIWMLFDVIEKLRNSNDISIPRVIAIIRDSLDEPFPILLLNPSKFFGYSTLVSVYFLEQDSGREVLIGHGMVRAIQTDQKVQVKIEEWVAGNDDIIGKIKQQSQTVHEFIIVRPSVARGDGILREASIRMMVASALRDEMRELMQPEEIPFKDQEIGDV